VSKSSWPFFASRLALTELWSASVSLAIAKTSAGFHCSAGAVAGLRSYGNLYVPFSRCSSSTRKRLTISARCWERNWFTSAASASVRASPDAALLTMLPRLLSSSATRARGDGSRTAFAIAAAAATPSTFEPPLTRELSTPWERKKASRRPIADVYCARSSCFFASAGTWASRARTMSSAGPRRKSGTGSPESDGGDGMLGLATDRVTIPETRPRADVAARTA
jgi:hypothetical protein